MERLRPVRNFFWLKNVVLFMFCCLLKGVAFLLKTHPWHLNLVYCVATTMSDMNNQNSLKEIEDITRPCGYTKFLFECWKIFHDWAQQTSEIFFPHEKRNFVSPSGHVMLHLSYKHQWTTKPFHFNSFLVRKARFIMKP